MYLPYFFFQEEKEYENWSRFFPEIEFFIY